MRRRAGRACRALSAPSGKVSKAPSSFVVMAVINVTHGFVFVHVPKSAGTSVSHALGTLSTLFDIEVGGTPYGEAIQPALIERWGLYKHSTAAELRRKLGEEAWSRMTSFAFVRNPFDRAYSTYKYLLQHKKERPVMNGFKDYNAFVESDWWDGSGPQKILMPQTSWTHAKGRQVVDLVGRTETMEADLRRILSRAGVPDAIVGAVAAPRENVSKEPGRRTRQPLSPRARRKILDRYRSDFEAFGYDEG